MAVLTEKLKEVLFSVLPVTIIILALNFTIAPIGNGLLLRFLLGTICIISGLTIFLFGVDLGIVALGTELGKKLSGSGSLWIIALGGIGLGFFISVAEPDLHILAQQVADVTGGMLAKNLIVAVVSVGLAILVSAGLLRIIKDVPLHITFTLIYGLIAVLCFFSTAEFMAIAFDASGATTGAMSTPFILALAAGASFYKGSKNSNEDEDSFGLVGIASGGAIIGVLVLNIFSSNKELQSAGTIEILLNPGPLESFLSVFPSEAKNVFISIVPLLIMYLFFIVLNKKFDFYIKRRMFLGFVYSFFGLVLFLTGVYMGFMDAGFIVGYKTATMNNLALLLLIGFSIGLVVILAEPAVYALTKQIEEITGGYIQRKIILIALSLGVGFAVALSMLRILIPWLQLWHFLLSGYVVSIILGFFVPKIFVGIAFDSGGVASGPMTATFVLSFARGVASAAPGANVLIDGFGIIAMVAMMAVLSLQILGLIFILKIK